METGKITRLVPEHGFGIIRGEGGEEVFFHWSAVRDLDFSSLRVGMEIQFAFRRRPTCAVAVEVRCPSAAGRELAERGAPQEGAADGS